MNLKRFGLTSLFVAMFAFSLQVFAHAALESSSPANKALLNTAPKTLELKFGHPTKLTKLKLSSGEQDIPVTLDTAAPAAKNYTIALPELKPGAYQVKWGSLSADGHAVTGDFTFTISGH